MTDAPCVLHARKEVPFLGTFVGAERVDESGVSVARAAAPQQRNATHESPTGLGPASGGPQQNASDAESVEVELVLEYRISLIDQGPGGRAAFAFVPPPFPSPLSPRRSALPALASRGVATCAYTEQQQSRLRVDGVVVMGGPEPSLIMLCYRQCPSWST